MAITGDDQWEWRSFKVGDGTSYPVLRFDPSDLMVRRSPFDRVGASGVILPRADLVGHRVLTLELQVEGTTRADLQTKMDALDAATVPSLTGDEALDYRLLGTTRRVYCRPRPARWVWTEDADLSLLLASADVEFYAQDPRIYSGGESVTVLA